MNKCYVCGSENFAKDVEMNIRDVDRTPVCISYYTGELEYGKRQATKNADVRASICLDCGTVRTFVDNPKLNWVTLLTGDYQPLNNTASDGKEAAIQEEPESFYQWVIGWLDFLLFMAITLNVFLKFISCKTPAEFFHTNKAAYAFEQGVLIYLVYGGVKIIIERFLKGVKTKQDVIYIALITLMLAWVITNNSNLLQPYFGG